MMLHAEMWSRSIGQLIKVLFDIVSTLLINKRISSFINKMQMCYEADSTN